MIIKGLTYFNEIKDISSSHVETDEDENFDGEWEYTEYEVNDGTIEENHPEAVKCIMTELTAVDIIRNKPQAELSLIQLGKIKTYEEYLHYTGEWELDLYGDMVYTEEEFKILKDVFNPDMNELERVLTKLNLEVTGHWTSPHDYVKRGDICNYYSFKWHNNEYCVSADSCSIILSKANDGRFIYNGNDYGDLVKAILKL